MADQLFVLRRYGNSVEPTIMIGDCCVYPALSLTNRKEVIAEDRSRPTGERGSGPYFHTYKRPLNGVSHMFRKGTTGYSDSMSYDSGYWDNGSSYAKSRNRSKVFASGHLYYTMSYSGHYNNYGMMRNCEYFNMYALSVEEPLSWTDGALYPKVYGQTTTMSVAVEGRSAPHDFEFYEAQAMRKIAEIQGPHKLLNHILEVTNMAQVGYTQEWVAEVPTIRYLYNERDCFDWCCLTGGLTHHCTSLASAAYINAVDNLPGATCNSIATVIECMESLGGIFKGNPPKTPKNIKDLWLSYRYAICTNKADIEEYAETTRRLMSLANASEITSNGSASDGRITCNCTISVDPSTCLPHDAASWLRSYGFRLSALNAWDMVPYSFVVDWFLHIGDILEMFENLGDAIALPVNDIWYSFRTNYDNQDCYFRVPGKVYFALPYVSYHETSKKTIGMRILDSIALFT